jgi:predicted RNA-binding protein YlqC (UPF0109 family)
MKHVAEVILRAIASHPDDVVIESQTDSDRTLLTVHVNQLDVGRVIGHKGRTINAVRTLVKAAALKHQHQVSLDLIAPDEAPNR